MVDYQPSRRTALKLIILAAASATPLISGCKPGDPFFQYVIPLPDRAEAYLAKARDNAELRYRGRPVHEELASPLDALVNAYHLALPHWESSDSLRKAGSIVPEEHLWYHHRCALLPQVQAVQDGILIILEQRPQDLRAENYPPPRVKFDVIAWLQKAQDAMNLMSHKELVDQANIAFAAGNREAGTRAMERLRIVVDDLVSHGYSLQHRANLHVLEARYAGR
jgi:hypothetical protein